MSAFIIAAYRTPIVPRGGAFASLALHDLTSAPILACLETANIAPDQVDELILSNALGAGGNPARIAALASGLPETVAGLSIDRQCCGGLDTLMLAKALISSGQAEIVLAGGAETYSRRPLRAHPNPEGGAAIPYDQAPFTPWPDRDPAMSEAADVLAQTLGISHEAQDAWAVNSHQKARLAQTRMRAEIVSPIAGITDDPFTRNLTPALAARAPQITGSVTAANTSVAADGAAFCLVVSERIAKHAARALRILDGATIGGTPNLPGLAPVAAIRKIAPPDLSLTEIMEAYAAQAIACVHGADLDPETVNVGGGSLARGHPIGASGAVLAVRLFHELKTGNGLAAIAAAGGIGTAVTFQA
ncbi:thiolase family protein [Cochlodiniinecator piscidefendens]|uniref:thiolase family protein n=1 Tax=Cochlodiniinecator piscidefendens TaxID=2715756 RepID=UPI00140E83C9|nr:thiolase family protein [Cochlodiniinecator piscidefendens]